MSVWKIRIHARLQKPACEFRLIPQIRATFRHHLRYTHTLCKKRLQHVRFIVAHNIGKSTTSAIFTHHFGIAAGKSHKGIDIII